MGFISRIIDIAKNFSNFNILSNTTIVTAGGIICIYGISNFVIPFWNKSKTIQNIVQNSRDYFSKKMPTIVKTLGEFIGNVINYVKAGMCSIDSYLTAKIQSWIRFCVICCVMCFNLLRQLVIVAIIGIIMLYLSLLDKFNKIIGR